MKKDLILVSVSSNKKEFVFLPEQERKAHKTLKKIHLSSVSNETNKEKLTDYFGAYVDREAPRFVLRALKTVYASSWNEKIEKLMDECFRLWKGSVVLTIGEEKTIEKLTVNGCKEKFVDDISENIDFYVPTSANKDIEKMYANEHITRVIKEHTYTMKKDDKGASHKIEVIPFCTVEKTTYGKVIENEEAQPLNLDVNDLIQVASLAMVELVRFGLVNSPSDMFEYRTYIYKKVNKYIMDERAKKAIEEPFVRTIDKNGVEHIQTEKSFIEKKLSKIDKNSVISELENILKKSLGKRTNKENVLFTFRYVLLYGHSQVECASALKIDEKQVRRYVSLIQKALRSPYTYELLNDCING